MHQTYASGPLKLNIYYCLAYGISNSIFSTFPETKGRYTFPIRHVHPNRIRSLDALHWHLTVVIY